MEIVLPHLEPWQRDVYDAVMNRRPDDFPTYVVKARRQVGKSITAEVLLLTFSLQKKKRVSAIVEPTLNQSRRVFKQITTMLEGSTLIRSANASLLTIEFINGSEILFKSAEQQEALRGMTISGILVIDEGAFIPDEVYDILAPTVDVYNAPTLIISTPLFQDGRFYEMYNSPIYQSFDWSKYDTSKFLPNEKLEQYRREMPESKFKSEYLGEFLTEGSFVFQNIRNCLKETQKPAVYGGIDWGSGSNGDYTVLTLMDEDGIVVDIYSYNNLEPSTQISRLASIINNTPTLQKLQVEKNSIGAVYADYLRNSMHKPQTLSLFDTTNDSKRRIIEQLASAFQSCAIGIPNDKELLTELNHYAMEKTPSGKITYNGLGAHDDYCISLALAYDCLNNSNGAYMVCMNRKKKFDPRPLKTKYDHDENFWSK